jgi:dihydropyrimidinase
VHLPGGASEILDIAVDDGQIVALFEPGSAAVTTRSVLEAGGRDVVPGVIDPHFQSGNLNGIEDFLTESRAAAVGGVTTILRMHRSLEPYADGLERTIADYESRAWVDFAFHLALMTEDHLAELPSYVNRFGVTSFKMFTAYKNDMPRSANLRGVDDGLLLDLLAQIADLGGRALVHCENQEINDRRLATRPPDADGLAAWAASRPPEAEAEAMLRVGYLASLVRCPIYLVHCSSSLALDVVTDLRLQHPDLAVETIIHYLTHTMQTEVGRLAKVAPPLRSSDDVEALWKGIAAGTIQTVGSDHVPYTRSAKLGANVWETRLGLPGTGLILPVMLAAGVGEGRISMARLVELTAENPARLFGLERKGRIATGMDADLVVVDRDLERTVESVQLHGASDWSLYDGMILRGWPVATVSRGQVVVADGKPVGAPGHGRFVRRQPARVARETTHS